MRLWTLHPKYLDRQGLLGVWREGLLAQAVLQGKTKGYKNHPQLDRFKSHPEPLEAVAYYLLEIWDEANRRGYIFDRTKINGVAKPQPIETTSGQLEFEFRHLLGKLKTRDENRYFQILGLQDVIPHPSFQIIPGEIEDWEKGKK